MKFKTIEWKGSYVRILDQRKLPGKIHYLHCQSASSVAKAIQTMAIRGAPAIGVAAAMGIALAAKRFRTLAAPLFQKEIEKACFQLGQTRPTAVNLFWAIERMRAVLHQFGQHPVSLLASKLEKEALDIYEEDLKVNQDIGRNGKSLLQHSQGVLTHCNAGALATAGYGTALGVIRAAWSEGRRFHVYVGETRPLFQGARLTAWELAQERIPCTLITDSMAGFLMSKGKIDLILVGADRIARNGDTANKIGTYSLAVLANYHRIPFYVVAPTSTIDIHLSSGREIVIEERAPQEIALIHRKSIAPVGVQIYNPAFDVTPHHLIKAIVTERGIIQRPFLKHLKKAVVR